MSTIITRSALVFHGHNPAPDVHSIIIDHHGRRVVTWADVMRERRERQRRILERKRHADWPRPHRVWVAYFDQDLFGGWQAFLDDFRGRNGRLWIDRDARGLISPLMKLFPLVLPLGSDWREQFENWQIAFASRYQRGTQDGRPRGSAVVWRCGRDGITLKPAR